MSVPSAITLEGRGWAGLTLTSPAFGDGEPIPRRHTADGLDLSPPMEWRGAPEGTRSFAVVLDDPDAPPGLWIHWVLFDLPGDLCGLPEGLQRSRELANGARQGACWGVDTFPRLGYWGPSPPPGPAHRYRFTLTAVNAPLDLPPGATAGQVRTALQSGRLAEATLTGLYGRS